MGSRSRFIFLFVCPVFCVLYTYLAYQGIWRLNLNFFEIFVYSFLLLMPFAFALTMPLLVWRERTNRSARYDCLIRTAYFSMAFISFLFFIIFIRDLFYWLLKLLSLLIPIRVDLTSSLYAPLTSFLFFGLSVILILLGYFFATRGLKIEVVNLDSDKISKLKIVQISDLHIGAMVNAEYVRAVVEMVNSESPDIVALTGDIIDDDTELHRESISELSKLKSKFGSFFVTGNHEYYWNVEKCLSELVKNNIRPLLNEHVYFSALNLILAGVTDFRSASIYPSHKSDPTKALFGSSPNAFRVLLAHQPASALAAQKAGVDLFLAGHTHGGQFFPWTWIVKKIHAFDRGLHLWNGMWIYISRGTGFWGPPVRLGSSPEITVIKIN